MFCIISFVVLSILGIFSASNRELAREALDCVLRRVTFRPCTTGFDEKMKAKILGVVITRSEGAARFLNRNFERLAWVFFVIFLASLIMFLRGLFLFYTTGSCNGANSTEFCVFDPSGKNNQISTASNICTVPVTPAQMTLNLQKIDLTQFPTLKSDSGDNLFMIACYHCKFSRQTYPIIRKLVDHFHIGLTFLHYPVKESTDKFSKLAYCVNKIAPEKFWKYNDSMFEGDASNLDDPAYIDGLLTKASLDVASVNACVADPGTETTVKKQMEQVASTGFTGTPTIFYKDQVFIGPKPYRVYAIALRGLFYWLR